MGTASLEWHARKRDDTPRGQACALRSADLSSPLRLRSGSRRASAAGAHRRCLSAGPRRATVAVGDVSGQTEQVMANLRLALAAAGAGLTDVLKTTVYVATQRQQDLHTAWDIVSRHLGDHDPPAPCWA